MRKMIIAAFAFAMMFAPAATAAPADSAGDIPVCCIEDSACCYEGDRGCCGYGYGYGESDSRGGRYRGGYGRGCRR